MPRRYFNWKLAIVLVIGFVVLGATAFGLRQWRRSSRAEKALIDGNKAYDEHKWTEAVRNLGRHLNVNTKDTDVWLKYAEANLKVRPSKQTNVQQAILAYRTILRADPNNSEAGTRLTEIYVTLGMPGEAELIAKRQLEAKDDPKLRRLLALALFGQRKFNDAAEELEKILQEHPDEILAYETLGQFSEQRPEDFPGTPEHWFNEAVNNNPNAAPAYIIRAAFHRRNEDYVKALADLEQAEKLDISEQEVRLRLAGEFINANILDKAEEHLKTVQSTTPMNQGLWQIWAQLALKSQSQEKMLMVAETGLKELASQPWDFMPLATELFINGGQFDRATECISKMKQQDISPGIVSLMEGLIASKKGNLHEAVKHWQQAIALGNTSPHVILSLASAMSRLGDTQSALGYLRTLVSERPDFFPGQLALAKLLVSTGNWAEASKHATIAMRLSPDNLEPALLNIRARMLLLATKSDDENAQIIQNIEKVLSALDKATNGAQEVKLLQLQYALQQHNYADAKKLVAQLKQDYPSQLRIAMAEVELLAAQDNIDQAISILEKTIEEFPSAVEPVRYLALLSARQGNQEKCATTLKNALERIENHIIQRELGILLAQFYFQWQKQDEAYKILNTLAQKIPNDIPIKHQLLTCEQVIKDPERAQQLVDNIKSLEGEDGWQWRYEQSKVWFEDDDFKTRYPQIISLLQENMLANQNDHESRILLGRAYERAGELQLAISTYREGLSRSPDDLRLIIPTVAALYATKEYEEAEKILDRTSQQNMYHPQLQQLQLQSHLRRGQLSSASDILQEFLRKNPNNQSVCLSLALLKMQQKEFDEASELLNGLKNQNPNSLSVAAAQVKLNLLQDKPQEALRLCDEMVDNLKSASAYLLRARTYSSLKQTDKALEDYENAFAVEPNNVGVWVARSDFFRSTGQKNKAIDDIQQAISLEPNDLQIQKRAISLLLATQDNSKISLGQSILEKALQSNPDDIDLQLIKVDTLLAEGTAPSIENAAEILEKITEKQPEISRAWGLLGEISFRQGQPAKALDIAMRGLAHKSDDRTLLFLKARAEAASSPLLAIPTLKVLYEQEPNNIETGILLANTYIETKQVQKAIDLLKTKLISVASTPVDERKVRIIYAIALYKNGDKKDAQKEFDSLAKSEPDNPDLLFAQTRLLKDENLWSQISLKVNEWYQNHPNNDLTPITIARNMMMIDDSQAKQTSEEILRMMLKTNPGSTEAMTILAVLLHSIGRPNESIPLYEEILRLEPDNVIIMNNLAWIMCEEQGKSQQALELVQRGLKIAPNYVDLIDTCGVVHYRLGEFDKAVEMFNTCIKLYPHGAPALVSTHFHLARAYNELGQREKAVEHLNKVMELNSQTGGLSTSEITEAQHLLKKIREGN